MARENDKEWDNSWRLQKRKEIKERHQIKKWNNETKERDELMASTNNIKISDSIKHQIMTSKMKSKNDIRERHKVMTSDHELDIKQIMNSSYDMKLRK